MRTRADLSGKKYGRLTVLSYKESRNHGPRWTCVCDCGNEKIVDGEELKRGKVKSCGCYNRDRKKELFTTHGQTKTSEYYAWRSMKERCTKENHYAWKWYGGKGVKICERWLSSFENFYEDMGKRPSKLHSLDRYPDKDGDYGPQNCRWATKREQAQNRSSNLWFEYNKIRMVAAEWERRWNVSVGYIQKHLKYSKTFAQLFDFHENGTPLPKIPRNFRKIINIETGKIYSSIQEAADEFNISRTGLGNMLLGKLKLRFPLKYYCG